MKTLDSFTLHLIVASTILSPAAHGATNVIPISSPLDRGWYDSAGNTDPTNSPFGIGGNYTVGMVGTEYRNFFIFRLPRISGDETIAAAELVLYCTPDEDAGYLSPDPSETYVTFSLDRTTTVGLRARATNAPTVNLAIFEDLGNGTAYNSGALFTAASQGTEVSIPLNEAFVASAKANLGADLALGGRLTSIRGDPQVGESLFAYSHHARLDQTRLILTTVPVPRLTISQIGNGQLDTSWHTNFTGYMLEHTTTLPATIWVSVTNDVVIRGNSFLVTMDINAGQQFFRLRKP